MYEHILYIYMGEYFMYRVTFILIYIYIYIYIYKYILNIYYNIVTIYN